MFSEIDCEVDIGRYDVLGGFDSQDLYKAAQAYDDILKEHLKGIQGGKAVKAIWWNVKRKIKKIFWKKGNFNRPTVQKRT